MPPEPKRKCGSSPWKPLRIPAFLSADDMNQFYHGFCNNTLWPLFHYFPSYVDYTPNIGNLRPVNGLFCDAVLDLLRPDDTNLWFMTISYAPARIAATGSSDATSLFLHIPFPSPALPAPSHTLEAQFAGGQLGQIY